MTLRQGLWMALVGLVIGVLCALEFLKYRSRTLAQILLHSLG